MVACFPDELVRVLAEKCPPEQTHTLVIWTKNPLNLLTHEPLSKIRHHYLLFIHFTITGMGGTTLEPNAPPFDKMLELLGPLVDYVGEPARIRVRFDPIVHLLLSEGKKFSNVDSFESVVAVAQRHGIRNFSISWMSAYKKVTARLHRHGFSDAPLSPEEWQKEFSRLSDTAAGHSVTLHGCCVPGMPVSRCIDGDLLTALHPEKEPCSTRKAKGQRETCGCTESLDIGWYNPCPHGCIYCYANPAHLS